MSAQEPIDTARTLVAGDIADRSQLYMDLASGPFFGANRPGALEASQRQAS